MDFLSNNTKNIIIKYHTKYLKCNTTNLYMTKTINLFIEQNITNITDICQKVCLLAWNSDYGPS